MEDNLFAGLNPKRRNDGTCDDDLTGLQGLFESGKEIGGVADNIDHIAGKRLERPGTGDAGNFGTVAKDAAEKALEKGASAGAVVRTEDDVALIDVTGERACDVFGRMIDIGELDGGP